MLNLFRGYTRVLRTLLPVALSAPLLLFALTGASQGRPSPTHRVRTDARPSDTVQHPDLSFRTSPIPRDEWFAMTLLGHPVGYSRNSFGPATWQGRPVWRFEEDFHLALGPNASFSTRTVQYVRADGTELETLASRDDPTEKTVTDVLYTGRTIEAHLTGTPLGQTGAKITKKNVKITLPKGVTLSPETPYEIEPKDIHPGKVIGQWTFDTDKLQLQKQVATVGQPETVNLPDKGAVKAWKVKVQTLGDTDNYFVWIDSNGGAVKVDLPLRGFDVIGILTPLSSVGSHRPYVPVWKPSPGGPIAAAPVILHPRAANVVDLTISGAPASLKIPSDGPQTVVDRGPGVMDISIATPGRPEQDFATLISGAPHPEPAIVKPPMTAGGVLADDVRTTMLASTNEINASAPQIESVAKRLIRGARTPLQKCMVLRDWVNERMREDSHAPAIRTAVEIMKQPRGVCRDYATLYAALARAAGIPTRVCVGMIYSSGGFWGHAWNESWTGEWTPIDATMDGHFVDATHVKLAQGDAAAAMEQGGAALTSLAASHAQLKVEWVQPEDSGH